MSYNEDKNLGDTLDFIIHGSEEYVDVEEADGKIVKKLQQDPKKLYYQSRIVNSQYLGDAVVAFETLEQAAMSANNYTTPARAKLFMENLLGRYKRLRYGIDAKSSETVRDKKNNQASLVHLMRKQTIEREFNAKDEKSRKILSGFLSNKEPDDV